MDDEGDGRFRFLSFLLLGESFDPVLWSKYIFRPIPLMDS